MQYMIKLIIYYWFKNIKLDNLLKSNNPLFLEELLIFVVLSL